MTDPAAQISRDLQGVAAGLEDVLNEIAGERVGFALLVFAGGHANYAANVSRADGIAQLKRLLEIWESGAPDIPHHQKN